MNGDTIKDLKQMIEDFSEADLPDDVTRKLLASMIITNTRIIENNHGEVKSMLSNLEDRFNKHLEKTQEAIDKLSTENHEIKESLEVIRRDRKDNPTLFETIKKYPKRTLFIAMGAFVVLNLWFISGLRFITLELVLNSFGLPEHVITEIMGVFFK